MDELFPIEAALFDFIRDGGNPWLIFSVEKALGVTH